MTTLTKTAPTSITVKWPSTMLVIERDPFGHFWTLSATRTNEIGITVTVRVIDSADCDDYADGIAAGEAAYLVHLAT